MLFSNLFKESFMKSLILILIFFSSSFILAGNIEIAENETETSTITTSPPVAENRWYYGGNVGFSFWNDYTYLGVYPLVGYKITPQFSVGAKVGYSYINYKDIDFDTHNYGGSVFTRYRIIPQIYLHGEFVYFSYERRTFSLINQQFGSERVWVPFLLLGGGFSQQISPNVWAYAEVLFDVINDNNSPYNSGEPFVSVGVGVGF
jgi:hypothetical protein